MQASYRVRTEKPRRYQRFGKSFPRKFGHLFLFCFEFVDMNGQEGLPYPMLSMLAGCAEL